MGCHCRRERSLAGFPVYFILELPRELDLSAIVCRIYARHPAKMMTALVPYAYAMGVLIAVRRASLRLGRGVHAVAEVLERRLEALRQRARRLLLGRTYDCSEPRVIGFS